MLGDRRQQLLRTGLFEQQGRRTRPQREHHQTAEPEREPERRAAREHIVGRGPQHPRRERVGHRQHIPVEVHAPLRTPRRTARERDQRDIVRRRLHGPERRRLPLRQPEQIIGSVPAERRDPQPRHLRLHQIVDTADVAQRMRDTCHFTHHGEFLRPLLGEHRHRHPARLHDRQPAGRQPRRRRPPQQHPLTGHHTQLPGQHMRQPVHPVTQLAVRPDRPPPVTERGTSGTEPPDRHVQQLRTAIEPLRIAQLRQIEQQPGPLLRGRQMLARERVEMSRRCQLQAGRGCQLHVRPLSWWGRPTSVS